MIPASCLMKPFCLLLPLLLAGCSQLPRLSGLSTEADPNVVFALGSREGFQSPLLAPLKPACPALEFRGESFALTGAHKKTLAGLLRTFQQEPGARCLVAGYSQPGLPEDYARSLSERRAQAVRQHLIESGIEATSLQTVGYGFDSAPSAPTSGVVVIYRQP